MLLLKQIQKLCKKEGIKVTNLEKLIGASRGVISRAISNNTDIQSKWVVKIIENFPHYNPLWLLTGKGNMILEKNNMTPDIAIDYKHKSASIKVIEINPDTSKSNTLIADIHASAGIGNIIDNHSELEKLPSIYIPDAPSGLNVAFQVQGDSMHPTIRHLDFIAANKINDPRDIRDGHTYILIDVDEGVLCKRVYSMGGDWKIQSDNPIYPPYNRSKYSIISFFRAFCRFSYDFSDYRDDFQKEINRKITTLEDHIWKVHETWHLVARKKIKKPKL